MDLGSRSAREVFWSRAVKWLLALLAVYAIGALVLLWVRVDLRLVVSTTPHLGDSRLHGFRVSRFLSCASGAGCCWHEPQS